MGLPAIAHRVRRRATIAAATTGLVLLAVGGAGAQTADAAAAGAAGGVAHVDPTAAWTVYHGNALGTGVDPSGVTFSPPNAAWRSPVLDGQVYGEPLEATGRVYVATENDTIYALAANTGAILWSAHLGTPVPSGDLPCGDISPTVGITGTPVIDTARGEIFAVADELSGGAPAHVLVGLNIYTGSSMLAQGVDPPGQLTKAILQRTGLNLSNGHVVFGYGGNDGDCPTYSGWVVSAPEGASDARSTAPGGADRQRRGRVDGGCRTRGRQCGQHLGGHGQRVVVAPYDCSDSVIELSPSWGPRSYFAPSDWQSDNGSDLDLGSSAPALLSNGTILQVGKSHRPFCSTRPISAASTGRSAAPGLLGERRRTAATPSWAPWCTYRVAAGCEAMQTSPLGTQWQTASRAPRPAHRGGRTRLVDRRRHAVRHQPRERRHRVAGPHRWRGQPLPDSVGR